MQMKKWPPLMSTNRINLVFVAKNSGGPANAKIEAASLDGPPVIMVVSTAQSLMLSGLPLLANAAVMASDVLFQPLNMALCGVDGKPAIAQPGSLPQIKASPRRTSFQTKALAKLCAAGKRQHNCFRYVSLSGFLQFNGHFQKFLSLTVLKLLFRRVFRRGQLNWA